MSECGLKMCHWHCGSEGELWKTDLNVCFRLLGCLGFPNQTRIDLDILYKSRACACALVYTKFPKWIQDSKIKTSNSLFHLVCLEFFHLVFTLGQDYASCFSISSPLICLGHCLLFYQYSGELSLQLCILPSVGFHSSGTTIWTRTKQPSSNVGPRADMSTAHKIRHSTVMPCRDMPPLRWCCKPRRLQLSRFKISNMRWGRWLLFWVWEKMFCLELEFYLCFLGPWVLWLNSGVTFPNQKFENSSEDYILS